MGFCCLGGGGPPPPPLLSSFGSLAGSTARPLLRGAILPDIDIPPQCHAGDMEGFANVLNWGGFVSVKLFHHGDLPGSEGFAPAAPAFPGSGSGMTAPGPRS